MGSSASVEAVPDVSVIVEWDNLADPRNGGEGTLRAERALEALRAELASVDASHELIFVHDPTEISRTKIASFLPRSMEPLFVTAQGCGYYEQKNRGATQAHGEIVVFIDCDVIAEQGWLQALLSPFEDPSVAVVGGNTYISAHSLVDRAFALFWYFPLRSSQDDLTPARSFFANNVAFRRELFVSRLFPHLGARYRGASCAELARQLVEDDIPIVKAQRARVAHPAPDNMKQGLQRGFLEGRDAILRWRTLQTPRGVRRTARRWFEGHKRSAARIRDGRHDLDMDRVSAGVALAVASGYFTARALGELYERAIQSTNR